MRNPADAADYRMGALTLAFADPEVEGAFRRHDFERGQTKVRAGLLLAIVLYGSFALLDPWVVPQQKQAAWLIRFAVVCPWMLGVLALSFTRAFRTLSKGLLPVSVVVAGGGIIAMTALGPQASSYYAGLLLVIMWAAVFLNLRIAQLAAAIGAIVVGYQLSLWVNPLSGHVVLNNEFFLLAAMLIGVFAAHALERHARLNFAYVRMVETEQRKSEALLLNILPQPVVERLRRDEQMIADAFADATILFADLVGFTELSARMPPEPLVALLNEVFSRFDALAAKHGIEKIKTIGDAYMVAAGLPVPRPNHAQAIADVALEMQEEIARISQERGIPLTLRIGINTGRVVAGVIGTRKFIYDLWGDSVNVASRMESHGLPSRIQVTEETSRRLEADYVLEERGAVEVKGKGSMRTFFLVGRRAAAESPTPRKALVVAGAPALAAAHSR